MTAKTPFTHSRRSRLLTGSAAIAMALAAAQAHAATIEGETVIDAPVTGNVILGDDDDILYKKLEGTVSGQIALGGGDDIFWLEQRGDVLAPFPEGGLDGGDGFDRFGIRLTESGTVHPASLPTGFERFALDLCGCDVVATIAEGTIVGGLDVTGSGTVTNLATITYQGSDAALTLRGDRDETAQGLNFINKGRIEAVGEGSEVLVDAGYNDYHFGSFVNEGTIALSGTYQTGLAVSAYDLLSGDGFVNRGEILGSGADSVTVQLQGSGRNEGTIRATGAEATGVSVGYYSQLTNTAAGTISGTQTGVALAPGARLVNAGTIEGGAESGVRVDSSIFIGRATVVNEQGGTIRSAGGAAVSDTGEGGVALANHGTLVGGVSLASGRDLVWLGEGSTLDGNLSLGGGDDTLMVAIDRFSAAGALDTSGLISGALDTGGGNDTLWLRADASGTRAVYNGAVAGFDGGLVYEAAGEATELLLTGPRDEEGVQQAYHGTLRVAGDGRAVIDMAFANGSSASPSIVVEQDTSAGLFGEGSQGLDLVLASAVTGGSGGAVDATNARRVELRENAGSIAFSGGTGLAVGDAEVLIAKGTEIRKLGPAAGTLLEVGYGSIVNRGTLLEVDDKTATDANVSTGLRMAGGVLRNERGTQGTGRIDVLGTGVEIESGADIANDGEIVSRYGNAIQVTGSGTTRIVNGAQGVITGHSEGQATGLAGAAVVGSWGYERIENAGAINGHVSLGGGEDVYVATGGTLTGDLDLGLGDDMLLVRDGAQLNITGSVIAGDGIDAFGKSFTQNASFDLGGNALPPGFEMHGVEVAGADATVTVTSAQPQAHGLRVTGGGTLRNEADYTIPADESGGYAAIEVRDPEGLSSLNLVNTGKIVSAFDGITAQDGLTSFANSGQIEAQYDGVSIYARYGVASLGFENTGSITSHDGSAARLYTSAIDGDGTSLTLSNTGSLTQTGEFGQGLWLDNEGGKANVVNSGQMNASGAFGTAAYLYSEGLLDVTNSGAIAATGEAGTALLIDDNGGSLGAGENCDDLAQQRQVTAHVANSGTVRATGDGRESDGYYHLSTGLLGVAERDYGAISVDNLAGGTIETTGASSVAVLVVGAGGEGYGRTAVNDTLRSFDTADLAGYGGGDIDAELRFFELDNAGTIRGGADTVLGENGSAYAGDSSLSDLEPTEAGRVVAGGIQTIDTTDRIVNRAGGTIIGNVSLGAGNDVFESYGSLQGNLDLGSGDDALIYNIASSFSGIAQGGSGTDTLTVDLNGTGAVDFDQFRGFENLSQRGAGSVVIRGTTDLATLEIGGSSVTVAAGTTFAAQGDTALTGSDGAEQVTVAGTVNGAVALGGGNDVVTLQQGGLVQGVVDMGAGDDRVVLDGGTATGGIDGGAGTDTVAFRIAGTVTSMPDVINFESLDVFGEGLLSIAPTQDFVAIGLNDGADLTLTGGGHSVGAITGDGSANAVTIRMPFDGSVSLGAGDDLLDIELQGTLSHALDGGTGNDTLALQLTGVATIAGDLANFETIDVNGASLLTLSGTLGAGQTMTFDDNDNSFVVDGGKILGTVDGGSGNDTIAFATAPNETSTFAGDHVVSFENLSAQGAGTLVIEGNASFQTVTVEGNLTVGQGGALTSGSTTMGAGDNVFTLQGNAVASGPVDGGLGTDRLVLLQDAPQVRRLSSVNATGFEALESGGSGEVVIDRDATFDMVDLLGAKMTVDAGKTLQVPTLAGGAGDNTLAVFGSVQGSVDFGAGDDRLVLGSLGAVTGTRSGGAGIDTLDLRVGTATQAANWDGKGYDGFERLEVGGGNLRLDGQAAYQRVTVSGGSFVGTAGSTITSAETIVVGQGAIFGSAGTVTGDIEVRGTLAPGASPGTMTVNGDVSFLPGSKFALEVMPTGHDLLDVSGKLAIASGATMDITGALANAPVGGAIDLAVADGGITGGFTTINKSNSIFGYVATRGNRIQILGAFENSSAFPTNAQSAIDYANGVLQSGQMVQAYTGLLPQLTTETGAVRPEGFARLTPESYATAMQASVDNGLATADALRAAQLGAPVVAGWYGFGQGLSQWSHNGSNARTGAAAARADTQGGFGGIGYATAQGSRFGAFIGGIDTRQTVHALDAETKIDGVIAGAFADVAIGDLAVHAAVAYDFSNATTSRSVRPGERIIGKYDLGGFVGDVAVSYAIDAGSWSIRPQLGVTYVEGRHDALREQGSAFALDVAEGAANGWFADASLSFARTIGNLRPYVEAGLRQRLDGKGERASGGFVGLAQNGAMIAEGANTDRTKARLGLGLAADVAKNLRFNLGYRAEFGDHARHNLTGGVSLRF